MANISNEVNVHDGVAVTNWISQINAGGTVYDIATHHNITFVEGQGGAKTTWNGLSDIEVVIPTIKDIIQSPIEFAGTVGADGVVVWNDTYEDGPKTGYLVFVTADCEFDDKACEAGDMAIYDGSEWKVVTGENQVQLVGSTDDNNRLTIAVGASKDVLTVEGKTLALTLDYVEIDEHIKTTTGDVVSVNFTNMTVGSVGIKLNKANDIPTTIGEVKTFETATALEDGTVTLKNATGLVNKVNFGKFSQGELPTFTPNSEKTFAVTGGALSSTSGLATGDFVDSVTFGKVTFETAAEGDENKIQMITGITAVEGNEFLNGIHETGKDETVDFTIAGYLSPSDGVSAKFVTGIVDGLTPVTSITSGSFTLDSSGTDFVTGLGTTESGSGDVVSSVSVSANNETSVLNSAVVNDHVLSFSATNVASSVTTDVKYKSFTKAGYEYTAPVATNTSFVTSGFTTTSDVNYTFGRGKETTYKTTSAMWKLSTPELEVTKGSYSINHTNMKATVPSGTFVASATQGTLPTLTGMSISTVDVTGTVGTALTTTEISINTLKSNSIDMPGAYSLSSVETDGDITVGASGDLAAAVATVDLSNYVTDVTIS